MTDKAYTDASTSFRASVDMRSRPNGGARPADKIVNLPPRQGEEPSQAGVDRPPPGPAPDLTSAFELIEEASEAIRISEARADELQQQFDRFAEQASDEMRRLNAEIAASEQRAFAAEARASEAEAWLVRLHDAIQTAFSPLHRRSKAGQIVDRSRQAPGD